MKPTARDQQNQTAPDQSNDAPGPALVFGKLIESTIKAAVYTHLRTGLINPCNLVQAAPPPPATG